VLFEQAASRWGTVITGDVPDFPSSGIALPLPNCTAPDTIDDLHICGQIVEIDGVSGTLGRAGPTFYRDGSNFPVVGVMEFDAADVESLRNDNSFYEVILHEMGHVVGIGTIWRDNGVTGRSLACPYRGRNGNREYRALSGCTIRRLPTELTGGSGARCGHFDDGCFRDELMTSYKSAGTGLLSRLSIATLEDIGYTVNYAAADTYTVANMGRRCVCRRSKVRGRDLSIVKPIEILTNNTKSNVSGMKRKLSDKGLQHAIAHGKKFLLDARKRYNSKPTDTTPLGLKYVGSDFISVLYTDGANGIFSVIVTLDDN
jgi:Leishmanolysin